MLVVCRKISIHFKKMKVLSIIIRERFKREKTLLRWALGTQLSFNFMINE